MWVCTACQGLSVQKPRKIRVGIKFWDGNFAWRSGESASGGGGGGGVCLCSLNIFDLLNARHVIVRHVTVGTWSKKNKQNKTWLIQHELNWLQIRLELCHEKKRLFTDLMCYHRGLYEPRHEKTGFLHMRKRRRRSASR